MGFFLDLGFFFAIQLAYFQVWKSSPCEANCIFGYCRYDENGNTIGKPERTDLPSPTRLKWDIPSECVEIIEYSSHCALALLNDVDLEIFVHNAYGKGFMKTCRVSPDAYIQMALQLAYFRVIIVFLLKVK